MAHSLFRSLTATLQREATRFVRRRSAAPGQETPTRRPRASAEVPPPGTPHEYPGDYRGPVEIRYAPHPDREPDPGEIVWAWVPYEEDHSRGKDRPVLLIGHDGPWLLGLQLTSQDHDRDAEQERRAGRVWVDIGSGAWDRKGRASEARVNRILRVDPRSIRREGAVLSPAVFATVAAAVAEHG